MNSNHTVYVHTCLDRVGGNFHKSDITIWYMFEGDTRVGVEGCIQPFDPLHFWDQQESDGKAKGQTPATKNGYQCWNTGWLPGSCQNLKATNLWCWTKVSHPRICLRRTWVTSENSFLPGRRLSSITYNLIKSVINSHFAPLSFKSWYLSHLSSEWSEIWHDDSLGGICRA